jgi:hypothetical protein
MRPFRLSLRFLLRLLPRLGPLGRVAPRPHLGPHGPRSLQQPGEHRGAVPIQLQVAVRGPQQIAVGAVRLRLPVAALAGQEADALGQLAPRRLPVEA